MRYGEPQTFRDQLTVYQGDCSHMPGVPQHPSHNLTSPSVPVQPLPSKGLCSSPTTRTNCAREVVKLILKQESQDSYWQVAR